LRQFSFFCPNILAGKATISVELLIIEKRTYVPAEKGVSSINIAFFLIPKKEVVFLPVNCTMRQAIERMEFHRYTAVPVIDQQGKYIGTLTEGDLLRMLKFTAGLTFENTEKISLQDIPRRTENNPVRIEANIDDLLTLAITQNFVPVVDDEGVFIGIIRRREIIEHFYRSLTTCKNLVNNAD
jgi:CBS domain-containing protein